jgi:hypothetical protein
MQNETSAKIELLVEAARAADFGDRRADERYPFYRPVTILGENSDVRRFSAFSRDISAGGMGLVHNVPVVEGRVTLIIHTQSGEQVRLPGLIGWCRPCGEGWYMSGARFISNE